ncbi:MAG TPA: hypothetical protein PLV25_03840, partial [Opitutales bacterium]|nr:hypothetical protein [Opitutales bacterium]
KTRALLGLNNATTHEKAEAAARKTFSLLNVLHDRKGDEAQRTQEITIYLLKWVDEKTHEGLLCDLSSLMDPEDLDAII